MHKRKLMHFETAVCINEKIKVVEYYELASMYTIQKIIFKKTGFEISFRAVQRWSEQE